MAFTKVTYPARILQKLRDWGVPFEEVSESRIMFLNLYQVVEGPRPGPIDVVGEIKDLKRRVGELETRLVEKREPTRVDYVYDLFKEELEKKHFGRIVAIDTDSDKIVGVGDTILEAYDKAKEKTGKDRFDFRRVGYRYIHKV